MFEVGFSELCMVGLVALLVIGPEKLPKLARIAGFWVGKSRTMVANIKEEIKAELHTAEMRQILKEQADLQNLHQLLGEGEQLANSMKQEMKNAAQIHLTDEAAHDR